MSTYKKCDRCGDSTETYPALRITQTSISRDAFMEPKEVIKDLCSYCHTKLIEFMNPIPVLRQDNPVEKVAEQKRDS